MPLFTRTRTNPVFYADQLAVTLRDEPERLDRMRTDADSLDLLTWNVFMSLDTHRDPAWLAYRLQLLGGSTLRAPLRLSVFSGAVRAPLLRPSAAYLRDVAARVGADGADLSDRLATFGEPIEVPVRIETPDTLVLVDVGHDRLRSGTGGRDRLAELVDAGLEHARRLAVGLALCVVADTRSDVLDAEVPALARHGAVAELVPWRGDVPPVDVHGVSWSQLLDVWDEERSELRLAGEPVRDFHRYARRTAT